MYEWPRCMKINYSSSCIVSQWYQRDKLSFSMAHSEKRILYEKNLFIFMYWVLALPGTNGTKTLITKNSILYFLWYTSNPVAFCRKFKFSTKIYIEKKKMFHSSRRCSSGSASALRFRLHHRCSTPWLPRRDASGQDHPRQVAFRVWRMADSVSPDSCILMIVDGSGKLMEVVGWRPGAPSSDILCS